jgi:hypothetical protein
MSNESFPAMLATLKRSAGALREAGIPFMLGGGLACWVRGGPESDHDLDLMVKPEDAEQALVTSRRSACDRRSRPRAGSTRPSTRT